MSDEDGDKPHEPTAKKLQDARKKGEVPRSQDLSTAAAYAGLVLGFAALGGQTVSSAGAALQSVFAQAEFMSRNLFETGDGAAIAGVFGRVLLSVLPIFLIPAALVLVAIIGQQAFVVTPDKLKPKLSRISILSNAKNKFGRSGLFEFAKSFVKLLIFSAILGLFLSSRLPEFMATLRTEPGVAVLLLGRSCIELLMIVMLVSISIGAFSSPSTTDTCAAQTSGSSGERRRRVAMTTPSSGR